MTPLERAAKACESWWVESEEDDFTVPALAALAAALSDEDEMVRVARSFMVDRTDWVKAPDMVAALVAYLLGEET